MSVTILLRKTATLLLAVSAFAAMPIVSRGAQSPAAANAPQDTMLLHAAEAAKVMPATVFFRGQSATTQARNSTGVRFADGMYTLAALVDTGGYSSSLKQRYQGYLITEVPLQIGSKHLAPGAYGFGFIADNTFLVMDVGGHDLLTEHSTTDSDLKRPTPLQMFAAEGHNCYRLYSGRSFATLCRTAEK